MDKDGIVKKNINKKHAFSLIELMFGLVVISVVLAALMPVITSQFASESDSILSTNQMIRSDGCAEAFPNSNGLECDLCLQDLSSCISCKNNCPSGKTKNKKLCKCQ